MSLQEQMRHIRSIYGERRNRHFLPTLHRRLYFLLVQSGDLQDAVRREDVAANGPAIGRTLAAIFAVAQYFDDHDIRLAQGLSQKYPAAGCTHCLQSLCKCDPAHRQPTQLSPVDDQQVGWTVREWHNHLSRIYGSRNRLKGIENILNRLFKEITELYRLEGEMLDRHYVIEEMEGKVFLELADVFSWLSATAFLLGVDPEAALIDRYAAGCPECHHPTTCQCPLDLNRASWLKH